ncbi:interleukin-18-like [Archocentrus centrarchus]|uniref:interleukin-18-like n=1 Tax=Archocentrus centrarchus TaxID=63155 RepID=UPI0011EA07C1|nr:interleukin-18-like [Archocentrus centrarchus]XP_030599598.1 interleukin-18-like [Archocentrus centrarchus]XP_030599599.1 interleukin-18-like [Archocentrus centrarchus]
MESSGCIHVTFLDTFENSFYFEVVQPDTGMEEDDFKRNDHDHWCIKSHQDGIGHLILSNTETQEEPVSQHTFDNKFNIVTYQSNSLDPKEKMPVMIYAVKDEQKMVVCYTNTTIQAEKMTPPMDISGLNHKALFYQTKLPGTNRFKFVSSMDHKKVLGVARIKNNIYKLVLINDGEDCVDESTVFQTT